MQGVLISSIINGTLFHLTFFNEMSKVLVIEDNIEISENIVEILN
jgi:hypothetical protein